MSETVKVTVIATGFDESEPTMVDAAPRQARTTVPMGASYSVNAGQTAREAVVLGQSRRHSSAPPAPEP
ncbi:MAG: hypothetical protein GWO04_32910, partial [Actinobacteria bacterium]|nr:hypothetical protein [Actinomycetota bacterium]NIW31095.1 hypothetical protein [Actinomycetota bacterium]